MKRDQRGFTLMELMIVIVIIGVLAAIGVPAYRNYVTEAREAACKANIRTISTAFRMCYAEKGSYPHDDNGKLPISLADYVSNIDAIAKCPADGSAYTIASSGVADESGRLVTISCPNHGMYVVEGKPSDIWIPIIK